MSVEVRSFENLVRSRASAFNIAINKIVKPTFQGLQDPKLYQEDMVSMAKLKRQPFPRQARLISAANHHLLKENNLIISAEMGTGKTISGISLAYLQFLANGQKTMKTAVMCPSHLVSKWASEIEATLGKKDKKIIPYEIAIIRKWTDLIGYKDAVLGKKLYFFIFSKESAKLGYPIREAYATRKTLIREEYFDENGNNAVRSKIRKVKVCPDCGEEIEPEGRNNRPRKCPECGAVCRQVDKDKPSATRLSLASYFKTFPKGWIDLLVLDELHELKGGDTAQGNAFGSIASQAKKCVGLTGTLLNGYASSLFYILFRLNPKMMKEKLKLDYGDLSRFIELYGAVQEFRQDMEVDMEGKVTRMGRKVNVRELPRINPYLLTLMLPFTIFLRLDEMNIALPDYEEHIQIIEPDSEWVGEYKSYLSDLASSAHRDKRVLGSLANDSISICDLPFKDAFCEYSSNARYRAPVDESFVTAKEKALVSNVEAEFANGRKCLVFVTYTNLGTSARVEGILKENFPNKAIQVLPASVNANKREKWIEDHPCDVLICNPELVKTGLDLLEFPTIIFYQTTYNVFTLKQASRRSWRIGQENKVKVIFMTYSNTAQRKALSLISQKLSAANSLEGRLSLGNDLAALEEDSSSLQVQLARAIMEGGLVDSEDEIHASRWTFEEREWDAFEKSYINAKEKVMSQRFAALEKRMNQEAIEVSEKVEVAIQAVKEATPETKEKAQEESKNTLAEYFAEDAKISVTRRVKRRGKYVEEELEMTRAEIQVMIQDPDNKTALQLSLF